MGHLLLALLALHFGRQIRRLDSYCYCEDSVRVRSSSWSPNWWLYFAVTHPLKWSGVTDTLARRQALRWSFRCPHHQAEELARKKSDDEPDRLTG